MVEIDVHQSFAEATTALMLVALMNVGVKLLGPGVPLLEVLTARFAIGLIFLLPSLKADSGISGVWNIPKRKGLIVSRAILGLMAVALSFYGFTHLPLAPATVLWKTGPMLVILLAGPMIGEPASPRQWVAGLLGFAGAAIMMQPSGGLTLVPALAITVGAIAAAVSNLQVRELTKTDSPNTIVFWYFSIALVPCLVGMPIVFLVPTWSQALLLILVGLAGGGMMMLNTWAYKLLPPATVAAYEYTTLIWATIFGWIIWHEWPTLCVWQGTILILAGILLASTTKVKAPALK